ncbi:MAG: glycosyltransferase family 9 protein [Verrucomicrobia bacterium]|nr:glycosyltransferase family 9 protein [Verrucomicrobiota bacterium]
MKHLLSSFIHAVGALLFSRRDRRVPSPENVRRIVITHFHYLGDVFFTTPAITALKRRFPGAAIDVVVKSRARDVLLGNPDIREIICFDRLCNDRTREPRTDWRGLRALARRLRGCDLLVDFTGVPASCALAMLARPRWSVGFSRAGFGFVFDRELRPVPEIPLVERYNALSTLAGADASGLMPAIHLEGDAVPGSPDKNAALPSHDILLHVGAGFPLKLWPVENFRAVAEHFRARGLRVALVGGPSDPAEIINLTLRQVAALARGCRVYVGLDTGLTHIVASLGVPTVAVYGPTNPRFLPRWPNERVVWTELACSAAENEQQCAAVRPMRCSYEHRCMQHLGVDRMIQEINQCLAVSSISSQN